MFAYIGISVGLATRASMQWSMGLILLTIVLCIVVRAMHVFPLLFLANRYRGEEPVKPNMQSALWLAGLRGPVCFMVCFKDCRHSAGVRCFGRPLAFAAVG